MLLVPSASWLPLTLTAAVAVAPEPLRFTVPSTVSPSVKKTDPVGVALPVLALTVAVSIMLAVVKTLVELAVTAVVVPMAGPLFHCVTRLYASTEPSPVTKSYPEPAL